MANAKETKTQEPRESFGQKLSRFFESDGNQTVVASIVCAGIGLLIGYIALLIIAPQGAGKGITTIILNFFNYHNHTLRLKYFGLTLAWTAPLLMCGLAVLFAYKSGLFNIGAAGQYVVGGGVALLLAFAGMPWWLCLIMAMLAGAVWGAIVGVLKAYLNVNEVISAIMLNWIGLYVTNLLIKNSPGWDNSKYETFSIAVRYPQAELPGCGLDQWTGSDRAGLAIILAVVFAILVLVVLSRTTFGYELKATGNNRNAALYAGMKQKTNIIITMAISGALAGIGGAFFYLSGLEPYYSPTSVPGMGFNGISAAFLGGLNPIGTIFAAYFLTHIQQAGSSLDTAYYSAQVSDLISAVIVYLCAFVFFFKYLFAKWKTKNSERRKATIEGSNPGADAKEAEAQKEEN